MYTVQKCMGRVTQLTLAAKLDVSLREHQVRDKIREVVLIPNPVLD
jgi:hypothetical protein